MQSSSRRRQLGKTHSRSLSFFSRVGSSILFVLWLGWRASHPSRLGVVPQLPLCLNGKFKMKFLYSHCLIHKKQCRKPFWCKKVHLHFIPPCLYWISMHLHWFTFFSTLQCLEIILLLDNGKLLQFFHEICRRNMDIFLNTLWIIIILEFQILIGGWLTSQLWHTLSTRGTAQVK